MNDARHVRLAELHAPDDFEFVGHWETLDLQSADCDRKKRRTPLAQRLSIFSLSFDSRTHLGENQAQKAASTAFGN
jgi:hypothetical protein